MIAKCCLISRRKKRIVDVTKTTATTITSLDKSTLTVSVLRAMKYQQKSIPHVWNAKLVCLTFEMKSILILLLLLLVVSNYYFSYWMKCGIFSCLLFHAQMGIGRKQSREKNTSRILRLFDKISTNGWNTLARLMKFTLFTLFPLFSACFIRRVSLILYINIFIISPQSSFLFYLVVSSCCCCCFTPPFPKIKIKTHHAFKQFMPYHAIVISDPNQIIEARILATDATVKQR